MVFPQTPLGAKLELQIGGVWTNATRYSTSTKILDDGIRISRGSQGVQDRTPTSTCTWTWEDPNGVYHNENPLSPYFGTLPRNTPVRVSVPRSTPSLFLIDDGIEGYASSLNDPTYSIVGDIDIRVEIEPTRWKRFQSGRGGFMNVVAKYEGAGNRSWWLRIGELGTVLFSWSVAGTTTTTATSTGALLPSTGRIAIRVQLDVDNGAGGNTTTFATAPTINGTYTTLGTPVVKAGVTSIFSSTAQIEFGTVNNAAASFSVNSFTQNYAGRIYAFQLRNSASTLVANPDFTIQANGTRNFTDSTGRQWVLVRTAELTDADYRFYGELSAPRQRPIMSRNGVGVDVRMEGEAGGLIRRLTTNATPVQSPLYKHFATFEPNGWWPGEDQSGATLAGSAVNGSDPATLTDITFAGYDSTLAGSGGAMTFGGTGPIFSGNAKIVTATNETHFIGYFKFPTVPLSEQTIFSIYSTGTIKRWDWTVDATSYRLKGYDATGTKVAEKGSFFGTGAEPTNWIAYHMQLTNSAGTITIQSEWYAVGQNAYYNTSGTGTISYAGSNGIFTRVVMQGIAALSGMRASQILVSSQVGLSFFLGISKYSTGYAGELATERFTRICGEQGITSVIVGFAADSTDTAIPENAEAMGPQPIDEVMNILYECQEVDGGIISEARDQLALEYRTRTSLYDQPTMNLSYVTGKHLSEQLESTLDDTNVVNDVTLIRKNGGSARAVKESGPMSILSPSAGGIGRVPDEREINNYLDSRLPYLAQRALLIGTWPEARYPSVKIGLHRTPFTSDATLSILASAVNVGDPFTIANLPSFMPSDTLYLMIQGYTEELKAFTRSITFNTSPYGPYRSNEFVTTIVTGQELRADASASTLSAAVTSTATSISVATSSGPLFVTTAVNPAELPFDILIGGERMTVTAVTGSSSPQTMTVTRSVNGVVKAQVINAPVTVFAGFNAVL